MFNYRINNRKKAFAQYRAEEKAYNATKKEWSEDMKECASLILQMRDTLTSFQKFEVGKVLYSSLKDHGCLDAFSTILNENEFLSLPSCMERLLTDISWEINDDGYMAISRLETLDDWDEWHTKCGLFTKDLKTYNKIRTGYAVWCGEQHLWKKKKLWKEWFDKNKAGFINPKYVSCQSEYIGEIGELNSILRVLADQSSYEKNEWLKNGVLDDVFFALKKKHDIHRRK